MKTWMKFSFFSFFLLGNHTWRICLCYSWKYNNLSIVLLVRVVLIDSLINNDAKLFNMLARSMLIVLMPIAFFASHFVHSEVIRHLNSQSTHLLDDHRPANRPLMAPPGSVRSSVSLAFHSVFPDGWRWRRVVCRRGTPARRQVLDWGDGGRAEGTGRQRRVCRHRRVWTRLQPQLLAARNAAGRVPEAGTEWYRIERIQAEEETCHCSSLSVIKRYV